MKLLIDTNVFIPLEPTSPEDATGNTQSAALLARLASQTGTQLWLHPAQLVDIAQDAPGNRRQLREQLFEKYLRLSTPGLTPPASGTNDWVDSQLIQALERNAVTALVTEDRRLTHKAIQSLGPDRVLTLADAISLLGSFLDVEVAPPPAVERVHAYELDAKETFWDSFRAEYSGFDNWFRKCQEEHRTAWVIRSPDSKAVVGAAIVNLEVSEPRIGKTLKICSLKVDSTHSGRRYGELLLKSVFYEAFENSYDSLFITAFPQHEQLIALIQDFGFQAEGVVLTGGERAFVKRLSRTFPTEVQASPVEYFKRDGPFVLDLIGPPHYAVPILPTFHQMLFPELQAQPQLMPARQGYGNSLRKAYLSSSKIAEPPAGSVLLFYRSQDEQTIGAWGVVEKTLRSSDPDEICGFVLPRTVYTREEIVGMCSRGPVLAIMFRQCLRRISPALKLDDLISSKVISAAPQSLMQLSPAAKQKMIDLCQKLS